MTLLAVSLAAGCKDRVGSPGRPDAGCDARDAMACADDVPITEIMTREVITASPTDTILDVVRKLEHYEISATPVLTEQGVTGVVSSDILARRTLYRLLQTQD